MKSAKLPGLQAGGHGRHRRLRGRPGLANPATGDTRENLQVQSVGGSRSNNRFLHAVQGVPAGGGFSTAEGLVRFARPLRGHRLLGPELTDRVMAGKVESHPAEKYACGFSEKVVSGHRVIGHSGGFPGINSQLDIYSGLGYDVAVMSNYEPPAAMHVAGMAGTKQPFVPPNSEKMIAAS